MKKNKRKITDKRTLLVVTCVGFIFLIVGLFYSSFSLPEPVRSISFASSNLNYDEKTPGSWKVEKSAEWIDRGKARITIDIDTILKEKEEGTDLILVLDTSESMRGEKLEKEKEASIKLVEKILLNSNNRIGLIEYNSFSTILSSFTNDKNILINQINNLEPKGSSYYSSGLTGIDSILKSKTDTKPFEIIIVSSSYPTISNSITVNSQNAYTYLKKQYPNIIINTVQYSQENEIMEQIKRVNDIQYIANTDTLEQVLLDIPVNSTSYDEFTLTEYIDTDNFYIESTSGIKVNEGTISFNEEEQKIIWTLDSLKSGLKPKMTIDVKLKEELIDIGGTYSTSKETSLHTKIGEDIEDVTNMETPILKDNYQVIYESNAPEGCSVSNVPESKNQFVFDKVDISMKPTCSGYQFKGWSILTEGVKRINDDYFVMPESDVVLIGEWSKMSISKSMNGEIYVGPPSIIRKVEEADNEDIWKYKSVITKVVFENKMDASHIGLEEFDISEENNGSVMAFYDPSTTTVYLQGNKKIYANEDSSYLFSGFTNLSQIDGLEYFDTANTINMAVMFHGCSSLTSLDLSHFDTSNVTNMFCMFDESSKLTNIDVSSFDTLNVTNMGSMFYGTSLQELDLSNFNTSNVTNMLCMFKHCSSLITLNASSFDTTKVTTMVGMFQNCSNLTKLDLSNFNTSSVTDMTNMFNSCSSLTQLDLSNFDTSSVTTMNSMFINCQKLTNLNLGNNFDTSNVTDMKNMFHACLHVMTTITILNPDVTNIAYMFCDTSIYSGQVIVNYTAETSSLVDQMIATKTSDSKNHVYSNVVKGSLVSA